MRVFLVVLGFQFPFAAFAQSGLEVGGGTFRGWVRHDGTQPNPTTFEARYLGGTPLLDGHALEAEQVALLSDWYLAYSAEFTCTNTEERWDVEWTHAASGERRIETFVYAADCGLQVFKDGRLIRDVSDSPTYEVWVGLPVQCNTRFLGNWDVTVSYNGSLVAEQSGSVMRRDVQVLAGDATASVTVSPGLLHPELRDETSTPVGMYMASLGRPEFQIFAGARRPGGIATVTARVRDDRCPVPLPFVSIDVSFVLEAGSGGHFPHQATAVSPVLTASIGAPLSVLESVAPGFNAASGILSGQTSSEGTLGAFAVAGEVAGRVKLRATAPALSSAFAPGASVAESSEVDLVVGVAGLVPIDSQPGLYHLSGNRFSGADLFSPGFGDQHDANHFIQPSLQQFIIGMAGRFQLAFPGFGLNIDDASLPTGGLFDVTGTYSWCSTPTLTCTRAAGLVGHEYHRFGTDLDIRQRAFEYTSSTADDPRLGAATDRWPKQKILREIKPYVLSKRGVFAEEEQIHVRFP